MDDLELAFGAVLPVQFGDTTYRLAKYTVHDLAELKAAAGAERRKAALEFIQHLPRDLRDNAVRQSVTEIMAGNEDGMGAYLQTPKGLAYALWLSARREHPELDQAHLVPLFDSVPMALLFELVADRIGTNDAKKSGRELAAEIQKATTARSGGN